MGDIKIDEDKFFMFLNTVKNYIAKTNNEEFHEDIKEDGVWMNNYIDKELKIRELMLMRKSYYDFYVRVRTQNKEAANEAYQKYINAKLEIDKLR